MDEPAAREVLMLAGYDPGPGFEKHVRGTSLPYEEWTIRGDAVLARDRESLRLAEVSPDRDEALHTLERVLDLIDLLVAHAQSQSCSGSMPPPDRQRTTSSGSAAYTCLNPRAHDLVFGDTDCSLCCRPLLLQAQELLDQSVELTSGGRLVPLDVQKSLLAR